MTLQDRLRHDEDGVAGSAPTDLVALLRRLVSGGRFHRDSGLGRLYHPGSVSLRESVRNDSLHIVVHGDHLAAHVDRVSPLDARADVPARYSVARAAAHNVVGAAQDLVRLLRGRKGDHRSHLECEWVWEGYEPTPDPANLLDPGAWSIHLETRVAGSLDEHRLRAAIGAVTGDQAGDQDPLEVVDCPDAGALERARAELLCAPIAMTARPPFRICLAHRPEGDIVLLNVNHGAADGPSAVGVLHAIARAYAGDEPPLAPLDFLALNELPVRPASKPVSVVGGWYRTGVERVRDLLARPARLAPQGADDVPGYGFHFVRLSVDDTRRVANVHRQGTARNVLLAGLHLAVGEWNVAHGAPGRRVGVLLPVDLRPPDWPDGRIANFSVTARVSTSPRHRAGHRAALRAVTSQKDRNKRFRTGVALLGALDRHGLLPLWAKQSVVVLQPLTRNREVDTAMLANVGWLDAPPSFGPDAGGSDELWFSSPARTPQCLCVGAVVVAGRLHLTFRYPHRLFGPDAARRFAERYVEHIVSVAERRW